MLMIVVESTGSSIAAEIVFISHGGHGETQSVF
jgi:hypothetical protein